MTRELSTLKYRLGCWLHERWRIECALGPGLSRLTGIRWPDLHNRVERLRPGGDAQSRVCDWRWTSELTVCRVFPETAGRLCRRCFADWPPGEAGATPGAPPPEAVAISVILPVGGADRGPAALAVAASFLRQTLRPAEVLLVEQSPVPRLGGLVPPGVTYRHVPDNGPADAFNKSRLMNDAVRGARAPWVLLHDADIVVPGGYLEAIAARARAGWEAVRPLRFLFNAGPVESAAFVRDGAWPVRIERVTQNFPGGSTAVRRDVYAALGGHDVSFAGWGGEDTEFLERLHTRRVFPGHFAPGLHLWHAPASKKLSGDRNQELLDRRLAVPAADRIRDLAACWRAAEPCGP